jgi:hypothetical protein
MLDTSPDNHRKRWELYILPFYLEPTSVGNISKLKALPVYVIGFLR